MTNAIAAAALAYTSCGLSVIPIAPDGSKSPLVAWTPYQTELMAPDEIRRLFQPECGLAVIGGAVSGGLEVLDFDHPDIYPRWLELLGDTDPELAAVVAELPLVETPDDGRHLYYRCAAVDCNTKLAVAAKEFLGPYSKKKKRTLIETRGERGYVLAPPSPAACHETGRTYEHIGGVEPANVPTVSPEERQTLLQLARAFDEVPPEPAEQHRAPAAPDQEHARPGDDFNARTDWREILEPHGWTLARSTPDTTYWRRPGKTKGISATVGGASEWLYVFSTNAPPLDPGRSYTRFAAHAALNHGGNFREATRQLATDGYGEQRPAARAPDSYDGADCADTGDPWDDPDYYADPQNDVQAELIACGRAPDGRVAQSSPIDDLWASVTVAALTVQPKPRRWLLRHPDRDGAACAPSTGDGLLTRGIVGILSAAGGEGKTMALCGLAVSVATGRRWLGHFDVDRDARPGRVLLLLGEETAEEIDRRLYRVARHYQLDADEIQRCAEQLVAVPLAGVRAPLIGQSGETPHMHTLRRRLEQDGGKAGWSMIAIDPLARLCSGDAESDNAAATELLQSLETLTAVAGGPAVLLAAHSSKLARRMGQADSRGVTGLTDASRWHATLRSEGEDVMLELSKSNYSRPMPDPLRLARVGYGLLRVRTEDEQTARQEMAEQVRSEHLNADTGKLTNYLGDLGRPYRGGVDALSKAAGLSRDAGRSALAHARTLGLVAECGSTRDRTISIPKVAP